MNAMSLGLAHASSRFKIQFSSDKVDTMIIQAIHLLEEIDKEMNNYAMRLKEWFGWHFPEIVKLVPDVYLLVKIILSVKNRLRIVNNYDEIKDQLIQIVGSEDVVNQIKQSADISMGVTISEEDEIQMQELGLCINDMIEYRKDLAN